jgi:hypothetical protein
VSYSGRHLLNLYLKLTLQRVLQVARIGRIMADNSLMARPEPHDFALGFPELPLNDLISLLQHDNVPVHS